MILTSLDRVVAEYALHFQFPVFNNEAEYEALITGLRMAKDLEVKHLRVHSDSQLIVGQMQGEYKAWKPNMMKYLQKVKDLASSFNIMNILQIPRTKNMRADLLSKLATVGAVDLKRTSYLETLEKLSIEEHEVMQTDLEPSWIDPILHYL